MATIRELLNALEELTQSENNQSQVLLQAIIDKLNADVIIDNATLQAKLQAIIDLLADDVPLDLAPVLAQLSAIYGTETDISGNLQQLRGDITLIENALASVGTQLQTLHAILPQLQAIIDLLTAQTPPDVTEIVTKLQAIIDLLNAEQPLDITSIIDAIHAETAETHEVVARLDYIGDQANLAAVKAAVLEVVARLDYIGDGANINAVRWHVEQLENAVGDLQNRLIEIRDRLNAYQDQLDNIVQILWAARDTRDNVWALRPLLDMASTRNDLLNQLLGFYPDLHSDTSATRWLTQDMLNKLIELFNALGLPMQGLSLGELLWQISINTKALIPKGPEDRPQPGMSSYQSTGMWYLPTGILPGSDNLITAVWDSAPAGTSYGAGATGIPVKSMLQANWEGWYIYVESSADNYARNTAAMERYRTNKWQPLTGSDVLTVYVEGHAYVVVWLAQSGQQGGGEEPGETPILWYNDVAKLNGAQVDVTYSAQVNSNDAGAAGAYTNFNGDPFVNVHYGYLNQAVTFRAVQGGGTWLLCDGATQLAEVDSAGIVLGPFANVMRLHAYQPAGNPVGAVIGVSQNWSTAWSPA